MFTRKSIIMRIFAALMLVTTLLAACAPQEATETAEPTQAPTSEPTEAPTAEPTEAPTAEPAEAEPVRIGALFPVTGALAFLGQSTLNGVEIAKDMINDRGGIWGGRNIELVTGDGADPDSAVNETERLISQDGIEVIIGTYSSSRSMVATEVAERHGVIYWEEGAIADDITERGFKNIFRLIYQAHQSGFNVAEYVYNVLAEKLEIPPNEIKLAIFYEDGAFGTSIGGAAASKARELGVNVVLEEAYTGGATDASSLVLRGMDSDPDVVYHVGYQTDALLFWRQAIEMGFNPKAIIGGGGYYSNAEFYDSMAGEANGIFSADLAIGIDLEKLLPEAREEYLEFADRYREKFETEDIPPQALHGWTGAWILFKDVLPKAGEMDVEKIREAAFELDLPEGSTIFGYGVKFDETGQNIRSYAAIQQWQNGELLLVYPEDLARTTTINVPLPLAGQRE
jgi:branched-chain amino acid transport system substrate-binding protein